MMLMPYVTPMAGEEFIFFSNCGKIIRRKANTFDILL